MTFNAFANVRRTKIHWTFDNDGVGWKFIYIHWYKEKVVSPRFTFGSEC